jgi:hypothetical protein
VTHALDDNLGTPWQPPWVLIAAAMFPLRSIFSIAPLFPLPKRTKRAVLAVRKVLALLVRATHVSIAHRHGFDAVLEEEILHGLSDWW